MNFNTNNSLDSVSAKTARSKSATPAEADVKAPKTAEVPAKTSGDQVLLSPEAQTLGKLESRINSLADVDMDKVAEIKRAITEGRFEINAQRIAENMLNQDELLSAVQVKP